MWSNDKSKGTSEKEQSVYARICLLEARQMELLPPQLNEGECKQEKRCVSNAASSSRGMKKNYLADGDMNITALKQSVELSIVGTCLAVATRYLLRQTSSMLART
ncbi:hypothetical protein H5410_026460 [Solanum commersonii]|uniref:Uncharacterized protein n=1 Tax=Solanum commersonii TaxID=4109 RepID=A0A9J5YYX2_SOLCO|nr:hypothetical protein H5410_026460 [Solanum commersonii]